MRSTTKCLCLIVLAFACIKSNAQKPDESFYVFKEDWSAASSVDDCTYFMQSIRKSDTEFVCRYYAKFGPMVKQECYKDAGLTILNGFFCWYNKEGYLDSCGSVLNSKKDGRWSYLMRDTVNGYYEEYNDGEFVKRGSSHSKDSAKDTLAEDPSKKEAVYGKGTSSWTKYISSNIKTPDRLMRNMRKGNYSVTISFTIGKTGKVQDVYLVKSVEWSADAEVFRVIENSPLWEPAVQKDRNVLYRQRQNIIFRID